MRKNKMMLALTLAATTSMLGCQGGAQDDGESEAYCRSVKPGTVTTVNHYCVIMPNDPVDPNIVLEHKGQRVGLCCKGCMPRWNAMSDEAKDRALAVVVAKGKP